MDECTAWLFSLIGLDVPIVTVKLQNFYNLGEKPSLLTFWSAGCSRKPKAEDALVSSSLEVFPVPWGPGSPTGTATSSPTTPQAATAGMKGIMAVLWDIQTFIKKTFIEI